MCSLHEIRDVELRHVEESSPYYVQKDGDGRTVLVQNVITELKAAKPR